MSEPTTVGGAIVVVASVLLSFLATLPRIRHAFGLERDQVKLLRELMAAQGEAMQLLTEEREHSRVLRLELGKVDDTVGRLEVLVYTWRAQSRVLYDLLRAVKEGRLPPEVLILPAEPVDIGEPK